MLRKAIDLVLILAIAAGGVLAWRTGRERARLTGEYERLTRKAGDLSIADASRVCVRAIPTGDPRSFAWRVYYPANYKQILKSHDGYEGTSWSSGTQEFIARIRFRDDDQGRLQVYTRFAGGSSRRTLGDRALADFLRGHWGEIDVEQLGTRGMVAFDPDQPAVFLRLTLPPNLSEEARKTLLDTIVKRHVPVLFEVGIGPKAAAP